MHIYELFKKFQELYIDILCFRYANNISLGDEVLVNKNDQLIPEKVENISILLMQGNGILANYLDAFIIEFNNPNKLTFFYYLKIIHSSLFTRCTCSPNKRR